MPINEYNIDQICIDSFNDSEWLRIYTKENQHRNYQQEILSSMLNSDIMEMILEKKKEMKLFPKDMEWYKIDMELARKDMELMINRLNFELRQRDPETKTDLYVFRLWTVSHLLLISLFSFDQDIL